MPLFQGGVNLKDLGLKQPASVKRYLATTGQEEEYPEPMLPGVRTAVQPAVTRGGVAIELAPLRRAEETRAREQAAGANYASLFSVVDPRRPESLLEGAPVHGDVQTQGGGGILGALGNVAGVGRDVVGLLNTGAPNIFDVGRVLRGGEMSNRDIALQHDIPYYSDFARREIEPRAQVVGEALGEVSKVTPAGQALELAFGQGTSAKVGGQAARAGVPVGLEDVLLSLVIPSTADWGDAYRLAKGAGLIDDGGRILPGVTRAALDDVLQRAGKRLDDLPGGPALRRLATEEGGFARIPGGADEAAKAPQAPQFGPDEIAKLRDPEMIRAVVTKPLSPSSEVIFTRRNLGEIGVSFKGEPGAGGFARLRDTIADLRRQIPDANIQTLPTDERRSRIFQRFGFEPVADSPGTLRLGSATTPPARTAAAGAPPPRTPPTTPTGGGTPEPPEDLIATIAGKAVRGEGVDETLLRLHGGATRTAESEAQRFTDIGNRKLADLGIGQKQAKTVVPREADIPELDELYDALHNPSRVASGEIVVPERLRPVYEELRQLTNWEESARLDFDPDMATVEDYFYRGWKPPEEMLQGASASKGPLGATPSFKKPRVGATYQEMREAGFEPLFWNPYEQWKVSRIQGIRFREQSNLIEQIKELDLGKPHVGGPIPEGWRVPEVGPAFEGKPFAIVDEAGQARPMFTSRWVVPDELADRLENLYGKRPNLGKVGKVDVMKAIDATVFLPKRAKLLASVFQQIDFLTRSQVGAWTGMVDALAHGHPIEAVQHLAKWPKAAADITIANFSPAARRSIQSQLLDTKPLLKNRPGLSMRAISEAGLSVQDVTILPKDIDKVARQLAEEAALVKGVKVPTRALDALEGMSRRGLFEGVYPAAIMTDLKNNIVPILARQFPHATDDQIAAMAAKIANVKYSTIPGEQSVIQNRFIRETLRRVFFSVGESEGLLRQGAGAIKGANSAYWREHWLGAFLGLGAIANTIHFASTGEPLPFDRYSPISKTDFGPLPFGYNRDFMAPNIPLTGRSGTELTLDVVGQLDTVFRILDPVGFLTSRESVPIRAVTNQITGTDFFGAPIDTVGPDGIVSRTTQLAYDMFAPIGIGQGALETFRNKIEAGLLPQGESRVGTSGAAIQSAGLNVRAETNQMLRDRMARESGFADSWDKLLPTQQQAIYNDPKFAPLVEELRKRRDESAIQGSQGSIMGQVRETVFGKLEERQDTAEQAWVGGELTRPLPELWSDLNKERFGASSALAESFKETLAGFAQDQFDKVVDEYYSDNYVVRNKDGTIDFEQTDARRMEYIGGLSDEPGPDGSPSPFQYMQDFLQMVDQNKSPLQQDYREFQNEKEARGYFLIDPDDTETRNGFWEENPPLEAEQAFWYSGVEGDKPAALKTQEAVDVFLELNAEYGTNHPVRIEKFDFVINRDEGSMAIWQQQGHVALDYVAADTETRAEMRNDPKVNALLVFLGYNVKLGSKAAESELKKLNQTYGYNVAGELAKDAK